MASDKKLANSVRKEIERRLSCDITVMDVLKNIGIRKTGICIRKAEDMAAPVIYLDDVVKPDMEVGEIADRVLSVYEENSNPANGLQGNLLSKDHILGNVEYSLLNGKRNASLAEEAPHRKILDLMMFYRCSIGEGIFGARATFLVSNEMADSFGISAAELEEAARKNSLQQDVKCMKLSDFLAKSGVGVRAQDCCGPSMYVITNGQRFGGAWTLTHKGLLAGLARGFNSDLILLPSSIHEIIAVPASDLAGDMWFLRKMVQTINVAYVKPDEVLSDSVYRYSRETSEIAIAA